MDIIVESLTKKYGLQRAVDNISFDIQKGEIIGFLGPNGAGKTTTMKILTCFMAPTEGDVRVGGFSIREHPEKIKQMIGYLPEHNALYQDMTVMDSLRFVAQIQGVDKKILDRRIHEMIVRTGLNPEKHKKIGELSKGYKQRVGLAQAMIHDPQILILDEPTSGLDPNQIVEIRNLIREIGEEKTVVLSTHILPEVEATCSRILIINKGKIVADGTAASLRTQAQGQEILKVRLEDVDDRNLVFMSLRQLESVAMVDFLSASEMVFEIHSKAGMSSRRGIFEMCVRNQWVITELSGIETRLEDIFRDLTMN
ncbi:MAG TPA: ATP-binding cassette domain-containing protein [Bacteroidales bacterium]|nr:ATP-binding cassette domain-containing protein [Lentimicrobiaceae bacterium]HOH99195.1 ATP-binding cassette domain-containing protein [Bacteroidales bacterium]